MAQHTETFSHGGVAPPELSAEEHSVLKIFRTYQMTPGKMLCLNGAQLDHYRRPIASLVRRGFLVAEAYRGGFSLTPDGYAAMNDIDG